MTIKLKDGERLDELHRNGYRIIQNARKFCFGMDAVLLSGFARVKAGERVLDLGQERELYRFFSGGKHRGGILPDWRSRRKVQIWRGGVWRTIIWRIPFPL